MRNNRVLFLWTAAFRTPRLIKQIRVLVREGYSIDVVFWNRGVDEKDDREKAREIEKAIEVNTFEIRTSKSSYGRGIFNFYVRGCYVLKVIIFLLRNGKKYNIIHAIDFDSALPVFLYSFFNGKHKLVYDIADFIETFSSPVPDFVRKTIRLIDRKIMGRANVIILPDKNRIRNVPKRFRNKIYLVNNAPDIDLKIVSEKSKGLSVKRPSKINLIYYGGFSGDRGINFLLKIAKSMEDKIDIYFAGLGDLKELIMDYSRKLSNVYYLGYLGQEEVLAYLSLMDISYVVYSPVYEHNRLSSPNKVFEAMAFGKPMIVAKGTSIDEIVDKYDLGYVVDYQEQSIKYTLGTLDKATLNKKEDNLKKAYKYFCWDNSKVNLLKAYNNLREMTR